MNIVKISSFSAMPVFKGNLKGFVARDCSCPPRKPMVNLERTPSKDIFKKI